MEDNRFRQQSDSDNEDQPTGSRTTERMANLKYSLLSEERRQKLREIEVNRHFKKRACPICFELLAAGIV